MPLCAGKCSKQEFRKQNVVVTGVTSPVDCPIFPPDKARPLLEAAVDTADQWVGCKASCQCALFPNQNPAWTDWVVANIAVTTGEGDCTYEITGTVQISSRAFDGLCVPAKFGNATVPPVEPDH